MLHLIALSDTHTHTHTQTHTISTISLDEGSARRIDLNFTTPNIHTRQTIIPLLGFEPAVPASEMPQSQALDRAATGIESPGDSVRFTSPGVVADG